MFKFNIMPTMSTPMRVTKHTALTKGIVDDDDDGELFLWYGWPTKGV